jgi:hypothetical protein
MIRQLCGVLESPHALVNEGLQEIEGRIVEIIHKIYIAGIYLMYIQNQKLSMDMAHHRKPATLLQSLLKNRLQWILPVEVESRREECRGRSGPKEKLRCQSLLTHMY